jgi:aromatic ring-opening dioxygenase LigB subunit
MSGIVYGCVVPHGWNLIPEIEEDGGAPENRAAMEQVGRRMAELGVEVIVLATPHNVRVDDAITMANVARGAGLISEDGKTVEINVPVDGKLTDAIAEEARGRGLPIALVGYAGNQRSESAMPLDWGTMVPLWFMGHGRNMVGHGTAISPIPDEDIGPPVIIVNPSRFLPREMLVQFGEAVADAAAKDGRKVAFVASCDWAHAHAGSRYGATPEAAEVDAIVVEALKAGDLGRLIDLDPEKARLAAIDGLWQALMLAGVMNKVPMSGELVCYEVVEKYSVSMLVATYEPIAG